MRFLLGVDSVHTSAAACDYLGERATDADAVLGVGVVPPDDPAVERDVAEALNVLPVRLPTLDVETDRREGDPATELLAAAADYDADELVLGVRSGAPGAEAPVGGTTREVLAATERPVVVVPQDL